MNRVFAGSLVASLVFCWLACSNPFSSTYDGAMMVQDSSCVSGLRCFINCGGTNACRDTCYNAITSTSVRTSLLNVDSCTNSDCISTNSCSDITDDASNCLSCRLLRWQQLLDNQATQCTQEMAACRLSN
jgi:hypothetical protein